MATGDDRLSDLPDDLLLRVLHFAPAKEAASTSVLSRRFGSLWRSSGAVNLAARVPYSSRSIEGRDFFARRDAFVRAAEAALAAADRRVTRLTFHVEGDGYFSIYNFLCWSENGERSNHDVVDAVVSHPAARRVEELRVAAVHPCWLDKHEIVSNGVGIYSLKLASLPSNTLRVLDLTNCRILTPSRATAAAFPRLETLRLRHSTAHIKHLHRIIDAAPDLATVHLDSVLLVSDSDDHGTEAWSISLRLPAATALVMINCHTTGGMMNSMEIDAPRLRSFTHKGMAWQEFDLTSPAPDMTLVHLHFTQFFYRCDYLYFLHNFTNAKVLKMKAHHLDDMAFVREFPNVERLELDGDYNTWNKTTAAIASLLHCCPVLRNLKLNLIGTASPDSFNNSKQGQHFFQRNSHIDFDKSIDHFLRGVSKQTMDCFSMDDDHGDHSHDDDEVSGFLPGLSDYSFACLQNSVTRVSLQFRLAENSKTFGVRLVKFFAENAMVLEELRILTMETES